MFRQFFRFWSQEVMLQDSILSYVWYNRINHSISDRQNRANRGICSRESKESILLYVSYNRINHSIIVYWYRYRAGRTVIFLLLCSTTVSDRSRSIVYFSIAETLTRNCHSVFSHFNCQVWKKMLESARNSYSILIEEEIWKKEELHEGQNKYIGTE